MVAFSTLGGLKAFSALAAIADTALALAATHGNVDSRIGVKIGADVAALGAIASKPAYAWGLFKAAGFEAPPPSAVELTHQRSTSPRKWPARPRGGANGLPPVANGLPPVVFLFLVADFITCLEQVNGFGNPDRGGKFTEGASKFFNHRDIDVYGILVTASVDPSSWSGPAAERYDAANKALKGLIHIDDDGKLVAADKTMAEILARQADQVQTVGEGLAGTRLTVLGAIPVVTAMALAALAVKQRELQASLMSVLVKHHASKIACAAGGAALGLLITLLAQGRQNAEDIGDAIRAYDEVAETANGVLAGPMRVPVMSRVPAVSWSVSCFSDISGMPSGADGRVAVGAVSGAGSGDDSPTPQTPSPGGLAQVSRAAAKLSGELAQVASLAQQAVPAKQAPAAKAASGAGSGQGVPVEVVTAGVERNQDPSAPRRVMSPAPSKP